MNRIKKDDVVKITTGNNKGKIGKVVRAQLGQVWVENVNIKERHIRPSRVNPRGGKKDVHLPIDISNVAVIHDGNPITTRKRDGEGRPAVETTKVGFRITENGKQRVAKKTGKEIK